jgi:hypothetical protein
MTTNLITDIYKIMFFDLVLRRTTTVIVSQFSSFIGEGRPQLPCRASFQARAGT